MSILFFILAMRTNENERTIVMRSWLYIVFLLCCLFLSPAIAEEASPDLNRILTLDVIIEPVKTTDNVPGVKASFCVKSTPERIWSVLTGYNDFPRIYTGLKKASVLTSSKIGAEVRYLYSINFLGIFNKELNVVLSDQYSSSHRRISWERVSGDLERLEGSWEIVDTQKSGTYLLVYRSYVKAPWYVPENLVRSRIMNAIKEMARSIRTWVERS